MNQVHRIPDHKKREHDDIEAQTRKYLLNGGNVETIDPRESAAAHYPIKRTRKAQVNFMRRRGRIKPT